MGNSGSSLPGTACSSRSIWKTRTNAWLKSMMTSSNAETSRKCSWIPEGCIVSCCVNTRYSTTTGRASECTKCKHRARRVSRGTLSQGYSGRLTSNTWPWATTIPSKSCWAQRMATSSTPVSNLTSGLACSSSTSLFRCSRLRNTDPSWTSKWPKSSISNWFWLSVMPVSTSSLGSSQSKAQYLSTRLTKNCYKNTL